MLQSPRARGLRPIQGCRDFLLSGVAIPSCAGIETGMAVMDGEDEHVAIPSCAGIETRLEYQINYAGKVAIPSCAGIET